MAYVFPAPPQAVVPVAGSTDLFPVHRIYCVGRNYEERAREMGFTGREPPFFFAKPADALLPVAEGTGEMPYPPRRGHRPHTQFEVYCVGPIGYREEGTARAVLPTPEP